MFGFSWGEPVCECQNESEIKMPKEWKENCKYTDFQTIVQSYSIDLNSMNMEYKAVGVIVQQVALQ